MGWPQSMPGIALTVEKCRLWVPGAWKYLLTLLFISTDEAMMFTYLLALSLCLQKSSKQNEVSLTMICLIAH